MTEPEVPAARRLASYIPATIGPWVSEADQTYGPETIFGYIDGPGEVRFFHNPSVLNYHYFVADQDILLLGQGADAVLAAYGDKTERSRLLIIAYADAAAAAKAVGSFAKAYMPDGRAKGVVRTENGKWTAVRVKDRSVTIVFDAPSERAAAAKLDAVIALMKGQPWHESR